MRKQYTFLLVMLLGLLGFNTSARPVTLIIDGGGSVELNTYRYDNGDVFTPIGTYSAGTYDLGDVNTSYYMFPSDGTTITAATRQTEGSSTVSNLPVNSGLEGSPYQIQGYSSATSRITVRVTTEADAPVVTDGVTFNLVNGTAKVYLFENMSVAGEVKADLTAGTPTTLELVGAKQYAIVPGEGLTLSVTDKNGNSVWVNDAANGAYGVDYALVEAWSKNTYTITTSEAPVKADSYDVTFNITGGGSLDIFYYEGWSTKKLATVTDGQSATLKANDTYYVAASDGYELASITDADGNTVPLNTYSLSVPCFTVNTVAAPSASFNVTLNAAGGGDDPLKFTLTDGSAASIWSWVSSAEKVMDLEAGTHEVTSLTGEDWQYYIVANDPNATLTVTHNGKTLDVNQSATNFNGCAWAMMSGEGLTGEYVVTTKADEGYKTVINVAAGSSAEVVKYMDGKYPLYQALNEGDNEVKFSTADAYNFFYLRGTEGNDLVTVTDGEGNSLTVSEYPGLGKYVQLPVTGLKSKYNAVTEVATPVDPDPEEPTGNPLIVLTAGSQAYYIDGDGVRHDLVEGDNILDMGTGMNWGAIDWKFYPADGMKFTSFVNADGTEQKISEGGYVSITAKNSANRSSKYTITTAPDVTDPTVKFVVNGGKAELKVYTGGDPAYDVFKALNEGSEDVVLPKNYYYAYAADGYELVSVVDANGTELAISNGSAEIDAEDNAPSTQYTITVKATEEPANTFTVVVDDASKVVFNNSSWATIQLENGENVIKIEETYRYIFYSNSGGFYAVTLDDEPLADQWGTYYLPVADLAGKVLKIQANYPDEDWTYTIVNEGELVEWERAAINEIVDGTQVFTDLADFDGTKIVAKAGSEVCLWAKDADNYDSNKTKVTATGAGNEYASWYNTDSDNYNVTIKLSEPNGTLTVNAVKVATEPEPEGTNFHVTDGSSASIYRYADGDCTKYQDLNVGDNFITLPKDYNYYYIAANSVDAELTVTDDQGNTLTTEKDPEFADGLPTVDVTGNKSTRFDITTTGGAVVNPDVFTITLTVNKPEAIKIYTYYSAYQPESNKELKVELTAGENVIEVPFEKDFQGNNREFAQLAIGGANVGDIVKSVKYLNAGETEWANASDTYGTGVFEFYARPNSKVEVEVESMTLDKKCEIFTDRGSQQTIKLVSKDGREITLFGGYNDVWFNESDATFTVSPETATVFVNGEQIEGNEVTLKENDLVKIYAGSAELVNLDFIITPQSEEAPVKIVNVVTDHRNNVEYTGAALQLLPGTEVSFEIEAEDGVTYTVTDGENELEAVDGVYTIYPMTDAKVIVTYNGGMTEPVLTLVTEEGEVEFEYLDAVWTATLDKLAGSFRITSNEGLNLGSNGEAVVLGVPYAAAQDAAEGMTLACGEATDVTITFDELTNTITVNGTAGIATIARDQLDMNAIYFDMAGRRIAARNVENGFYIQVANGAARKIAVK